jgi:hypothetical protein
MAVLKMCLALAFVLALALASVIVIVFMIQATDWAKSRHLGYFLLNQFSAKQAVSMNVLLKVF